MTKKTLTVSQIKDHYKDLRNLVFRGGGWKGFVYPGAIRAMEELDLIGQIECVAGSSAGAIAATIVGLGCSADEFESFMQEQESMDLVDIIQKPTPVKKPPTQTFSVFIAHGDKLYNFYHQLIYRCVKARLDELLLDETNIRNLLDNIRQSINNKSNLLKKLQQKQQAINLHGSDDSLIFEEQKKLSDEIAELNKKKQDLINNAYKLHKLQQNVSSNSNYKITFADIRLIRKYLPQKVKDIHITATNITNNNETFYFCEKNSPNVEVALALSASTAIPGFFKPVDINGTRYIDGGTKINFPINYFLNEQENHGKLTTLGLIPSNRPYPKTGTDNKTFLEKLKDLFVYLFYSIDRSSISRQELARTQTFIARGNCKVVELPIGNIGTFSSGISPPEQQNLSRNAHSTLHNTLSCTTQPAEPSTWKKNKPKETVTSYNTFGTLFDTSNYDDSLFSNINPFVLDVKQFN